MARKKTPKEAMTTSERVKKNVGAIHTSGVLTLLERKMVNVLLLNAYDALLTRRTHKIPVQHLCLMLGWDESKNIERLQDVLRQLASTAVEFNMMEDGKEAWRIMSMLSYGEIKEGICTYRYDEYLAERLYDPEVYATINIGVQRRFEGGYALTIYENCLRYKSVGSTGWWELARFRRIIGADNEYYDDFRRLNSKIIKPSITEINKVSDLKLEVDFQRKDRKVSAIRFRIIENQQQSLLKPEAIDQYAEIREHPTYKRLIEHGIGDRLAISWVMQDEQRAIAAIEYVEERDKKNQIKGSTAGYIRKLIEDNAEVKPSTYTKKKEAVILLEEKQGEEEDRKKKLKELEEKYTKHLHHAAVKALTLEQRTAHAQAWFKTPKGTGREAGFDAQKGVFQNASDNINFTHVYLRQVLAQSYTMSDFKAWLKSSEKINPKYFGL